MNFFSTQCNSYWAVAQPDWAIQWPNGTGVMFARGPGMSPCSADWRKLYIAQVVELINMGADAFFFDGPSQPAPIHRFCVAALKRSSFINFGHSIGYTISCSVDCL